LDKKNVKNATLIHTSIPVIGVNGHPHRADGLDFTPRGGNKQGHAGPQSFKQRGVTVDAHAKSRRGGIWKTQSSFLRANRIAASRISNQALPVDIKNLFSY
jgi:hypothetical protein